MITTIKIDKKNLSNVLAKALCQKGQSKLIKSIPLRLDKGGISYMKIDGESTAAFGRFKASSFKTYNVKQPMDIVIGEMHVSNLKYIRSDPVIIESHENVLTLRTERDKLVVKATSDEEFNEKFQKNLKIQDSEGNKFPCLSKSLHTEDFDPESEDYSPLVAYLILETSEISQIPDCDSIIIKGNEERLDIESVDFGGGTASFSRELRPKFFEPLQDSFSVRIDKSFFDLVLGQFSKLVNITLAEKYVMFLEVKKDIYYGYMISTMSEQQEAITEDFVDEIEELSDLENIEEELDETIEELTDTESK